ncbi:MAG: kelch repeat-containing protein [Elusimicrobia bacterium]|nr:kelch repeat-containing protein [Elusimicrobiota bacterium]
MKIKIKKWFFICLSATTYFLLPTSCLYAGSSTTYTNDNHFNAGMCNDTIVYGTGDSAYVGLANNFDNISTVSNPTARRWSAAAYNSSEDKIILFGGYNDISALNDTWIYNPATEQWTQKSPSIVPPGRYGHILVSAGSTKAILFGGWNGSDYLNDTYEYDFNTNNWTKVDTIPSPTACAYSCAAYDSFNNKIILFGGQTYESVKSSQTWIYHISGSSWTRGSYGPSSRKGAAGCYDSENKKIILFGGENESGTFLSDTWAYDCNTNIWSNRNPSAIPTVRTEASMIYDSRNKKTVLFGGIGITNLLKNDVWYYSYDNNKWSTSSPASPPSARYGFSLNYISSLQKAFLFGGRDGSVGSRDDSYYYICRSSGIYTTVYYDVPFSTKLYWSTIEAPNQSGIPSNTTIKFQVASSADNNTYSAYTDYLDNPNDYCIYSGSPFTISSSHNNRRYLKIRFYFETTEPPLSGQLQRATVSFNRSPNGPSLSSPSNNFSTNDTTPDFSWYAGSDDDGDPITYQIEVDNDADFLSPVITSSNIVTTSYSTTTVMGHGKYFWRVCANDGSSYSLWTSTYTLYIDTIPPSSITSFSAVIGSYNGTINLSWSAPGNDRFFGDILSGKYFVRKATYPILTDADWQQNYTNEKIISKPLISPNETQTLTFDGLANGTTYYFSVKTQDGTDNISEISGVSPVCMTNAVPIVIIKSPNGSEVYVENRYIYWEYSDAYPPNDTHTFSIYDSSDGINFNSLIVSGLSNNTTSYLWNTKSVKNSSSHKIKVVACDIRGLEGYDVSDNIFTVDNLNVAPIVALTVPNGTEKISGNYTISFTVSDTNLSDNHIYTIYASTNSGISYDVKIVENLTVTNYLWDTTKFVNSPKYRVKVVATDNGSPNLSGEDYSDANFEVNNNNKTPSTPVLISPLDDSYNTMATIKFVWQKSVDPNPEDFLTYTIYYSTDSYFLYKTMVTGITETEYTPSNLAENIKYYWKVTAVDPFGYSAVSNPFSFIASWSRDDSDDGKVRVEVSEGLPKGYYVKVENTNTDFAIAIKNSISDRLIKCLNQPAYKLTIYDKSNIPQNLNIKGTARFKYSDRNGDGYVDGTDVKINNIRIAYLNESKNSWKFPNALQVIDKAEKYVKVNIEQNAYFTMVASVIPTKKVSNIVNFPNPFNPEKENTTIKYVLTESGKVILSIFNLVGDLVYRINMDEGTEGAIGQPEGYTNEVVWDGKNGNGTTVANGIYIMEIKRGNEKDIRKIAVVK